MLGQKRLSDTKQSSSPKRHKMTITTPEVGLQRMQEYKHKVLNEPIPRKEYKILKTIRKNVYLVIPRDKWQHTVSNPIESGKHWQIAKVINSQQMMTLVCLSDTNCIPTILRKFVLSSDPSESVTIFTPYHIPLDELIKRNHDLTPKQRMNLCLKMAQAVTEFHEAGFVHRDLNIHNFVYDADQRRILIIDLDTTVHSVTADNKLLKGRLTCHGRFCAPDALLLDSHTRASDVWSMAVCFVWICHGNHNEFTKSMLNTNHIDLLYSLTRKLFPLLCPHDNAFSNLSGIDKPTENKKIPLQQRWKTTPKPIIHALEHIFVWNPNDRWTAQQVVEHLTQDSINSFFC